MVRADLPPIVLLSDTALLWTAVREDMPEGLPAGSKAALDSALERASEHWLVRSLVEAARRARPELSYAGAELRRSPPRRLRAAFIGALSGDTQFVVDSFMVLARDHMGASAGEADARLVRCAAGTLSADDRAWLEGADVIVVGGCVPPEFAPDVKVEIGLRPGLLAMHGADAFRSIKAAQSSIA